MILQTQCQVCKCRMTIEWIPNDFISKELAGAMAVCDSCYKKRGQPTARDYDSPKPQRNPTKITRQPHND